MLNPDCWSIILPKVGYLSLFVCRLVNKELELAARTEINRRGVINPRAAARYRADDGRYYPGWHRYIGRFPFTKLLYSLESRSTRPKLVGDFSNLTTIRSGLSLLSEEARENLRVVDDCIDLIDLASLPNLREIGPNGSVKIDHQVTQLEALTPLKAVTLEICRPPIEQAPNVLDLSCLTNLQQLTVGYQNEDQFSINFPSTITKLNLHGTNLDPVKLDYLLHHLVNLEDLTVNFPISTIQCYPLITKLRLSSSLITNIDQIFPQLTSLFLQYVAVRGSLPVSLVNLEIHRCNQDFDLTNLTNLRSLTVRNSGNNWIYLNWHWLINLSTLKVSEYLGTNEQLMMLPNLVNLELGMAYLTSLSLPKLQTLVINNQCSLDLTHCTNLTSIELRADLDYYQLPRSIIQIVWMGLWLNPALIFIQPTGLPNLRVIRNNNVNSSLGYIRHSNRIKPVRYPELLKLLHIQVTNYN